MLGSLSVRALLFTPLNRPLRRFAGGGGPVGGVSSQVEQGGATMLPIGGLTVTVCATVEKTKHPTGEKFFIPVGVTSCAILGRCLRTEFRHDSCNTAPR
jgi:hypothetical protein